MTRFGRLASIRVMHAFDGEAQPTSRVALRPVDRATLTRHRMVLRATPGELLIGVPLGSDDRPRFGLPSRLDLAVVAEDPAVDGVTDWPATLLAERPVDLHGVARRAMPMYRGHIEPGGAVVTAEPMPEPTFVTRGSATLAVAADGPLPLTLQDGHGEAVVDRTADPDPQGRVVLRAELADRPADRWAVTVGTTTHRVYAAELPVGTVALLRLTLADDAPLPGPTVELDLDARAETWTWRIIPRDSAAAEAARYSIEHDTLAVSGAATTVVGDRPGLAFTSAAPIPWRAQPQGGFSLWFTRADDTRQLLVEQLPTPSPRALRPAVDVYL